MLLELVCSLKVRQKLLCRIYRRHSRPPISTRLPLKLSLAPNEPAPKEAQASTKPPHKHSA